MTDHKTFHIFCADVPANQVVKSPVSRLVVDVERFEQDEEEAMSQIGMGVIYQVTHDLRPLRRSLTKSERESLLERWYRPHHLTLTTAVDHALENFGRALIIDAHSFPFKALPYESDAEAQRPEICIGTDSFHTPVAAIELLQREFESLGFSTAINSPFSGALVSSKHYRRDGRVATVMIEVRRDLYLDERTGQLNANSNDVSRRLRSALLKHMTFLTPAFQSFPHSRDIEASMRDMP